MQDYYTTLEVDATATPAEIKASFRRLAKKYHPDRNNHRSAWADARMKEIIQAYSTLIDEKRRMLYDHKRRIMAAQNRDYYREMLLRGRHKPEYRAALILYDLLAGKPTDAIHWYEEGLVDDPEFNVARWLSPKDGLDCQFLLAEEYERQERHEAALELYEAVYYHEGAKARFGRFLGEVRERIRNLCCRELARSSTPSEAIQYYRRLFRMDMSRSERAFLHKKIAESYQRMNDYEHAIEEMRIAFELYPRLKGTSKVCAKLGIEPGGKNAKISNIGALSLEAKVERGE